MTPLDGGHRHAPGPARAGVDPHRARRDPHARASCRWAPEGAVRHLSSADLDDLGVQIVLGNTYHLMLKPGRRRRSRRSAACTASPTGRATCSPTPAATRSSRSSPAATWPRRRRRHVPVHLRRRHPPPHARVGGRHPDAARQRHPDGARRVRAAPVAARRAAGGRRPHRRVGRRGPGPTFLAPGPARAEPVRHRAGRHRPRPARRERRAHPRGRLRRLRDRRAVGRGVPRRHARHPGGHAPAAPRRPAPLPHGPRRPARDRRGGGAGRSTCSTACCPTRFARHGTILSSQGRYNLKRAENTAADAPLDDGLRLPGVRPLVPGLPAPPADRGRAHRPPAPHPPQRVVDAARWWQEVRTAVRGRATSRGCVRESPRPMANLLRRLSRPSYGSARAPSHAPQEARPPHLHRPASRPSPSAPCWSPTPRRSSASTSRAACPWCSSPPRRRATRPSSQTIEIIRSRVDALGVAEPEIARQGNSIVVQLPGVENQQRALDLVGATAELRFRPVLLDPRRPRRPARRPPTTRPRRPPRTGRRPRRPPTASTTTTTADDDDHGAGRARPPFQDGGADGTDDHDGRRTARPPPRCRASRRRLRAHAPRGGPPRRHGGPRRAGRRRRGRRHLPARALAGHGQDREDRQRPAGTNRRSGASSLEMQGRRGRHRPVQRHRRAVQPALARPAPPGSSPSCSTRWCSRRRRSSSRASSADEIPIIGQLHASRRPRTWRWCSATARCRSTLEPQTVQTVSPTLGEDSLQAGLAAGPPRPRARVPLHDLLLPGPRASSWCSGSCVWASLLYAIISHARGGAEPGRRHRHRRVRRRDGGQLRRVLRAAQGRGAGRPHAAELHRASLHARVPHDPRRRHLQLHRRRRCCSC